MKRSRFVPARVLYLWEKFGLKRIELFTSEDLEKKPEIPSSSKAVKKLKEASDQAEHKRRFAFKKRLHP